MRSRDGFRVRRAAFLEEMESIQKALVIGAKELSREGQLIERVTKSGRKAGDGSQAGELTERVNLSDQLHELREMDKYLSTQTVHEDIEAGPKKDVSPWIVRRASQILEHSNINPCRVNNDFTRTS